MFILIQIIHIFTKLALENLSLSLHTNFHMSSDTKDFCVLVVCWSKEQLILWIRQEKSSIFPFRTCHLIHNFKYYKKSLSQLFEQTTKMPSCFSLSFEVAHAKKDCRVATVEQQQL